MKKPELIKKAWRVYHDGMIGHPDKYGSIDEIDVVYADTANEAKMGNHDAYDWYLDGDYNTYPSYTDLKVKRVKYMDKVMFEDREIKRNQHDSIVQERERIEKRREKLMKLPDNEYFYVQDSRGYVGNAVLWWAIDSKGYVTDLSEAHKYTKQEILDKFVSGRETDIIWVGSHVEKAIRKYVDSQYLSGEFAA